MMIMNKIIFQRQLFPVIKKGQVMSNYYRLMNRQGGQRYCCYQLDLDHLISLNIILTTMIRWLHLDADLRNSSMQYQEQR